MIADDIRSIQPGFYQIRDEVPWNLLAMVNPYIFYYWTQGYPQKNWSDDYKVYCTQLLFCVLMVVLGLLLFVLVIWLDSRKFQEVQGRAQDNRKKVERPTAEFGANRLFLDAAPVVAKEDIDSKASTYSENNGMLVVENLQPQIQVSKLGKNFGT